MGWLLSDLALPKVSRKLDPGFENWQVASAACSSSAGGSQEETVSVTKLPLGLVSPDSERLGKGASASTVSGHWGWGFSRSCSPGSTSHLCPRTREEGNAALLSECKCGGPSKLAETEIRLYISGQVGGSLAKGGSPLA